MGRSGGTAYLSTGHGPDHRTDLVRIEALGFFDDMVRELGSNPAELIQSLHIRPEVLGQHNALLPYRQMVALLEHPADSLDCPDFGLRLGKRQSAVGVLGPLDIAMRNSLTLGEAFRYCADHVYTYCASTTLGMAHDASGRWVLRFEILLDRLPRQRQAVEHALFVTHLAVLAMSDGKARPREIWFTHEPASSMASYRQYFGAPVYFGQPYNAIFLDACHEATPIPGRNDQLYELATRYIDVEFPKPDLLISTRVRSLVAQQLSSGGKLHVEIAAALGLHPRTLQRRLREEGTSFESIRDEVRREAAWRYLNQTRLPLIRIANLLGYSELSAFSRSCIRWFAHSPREFRQHFSEEMRSKKLALTA